MLFQCKFYTVHRIVNKQENYSFFTTKLNGYQQFTVKKIKELKVNTLSHSL